MPTDHNRKGLQPISLPVFYDALSHAEKRAVRSRYTKLQGGLCYHCKARLDAEPPSSIKKTPINMKLFPAGFMDHPIHLQHSHETGLTEGSVHARCNAVLWQYHGQ
jgi:hypothetical protein